MKKTKITPLLLALPVVSLGFLTACSDDEDPTPTPGGDEIETLADGSILEGNYSKNIKLAKGNDYILKSAVHIKPGYTIYVEAGVTVRADVATVAYLLVEPGAKIEAVGNENDPIVFTSGAVSPNPQDWGGIILCGKAPINVGTGTAASEMGAGVVYGGTDPNDNSGTLQYVRVEYSGKKQSGTKEHNGFTFEGVGAGTTLEYLCSYKGGDDGIEFFGGTANLKYAVVYGAQDDMFDWTYGWRGNGQFWVGVQGDDVADRGFEGDNNGDDNEATPFSSPTISNVTLVGSRTAATGDDPTTATETGKTRALKLREGTAGSLYNFVIYGFNNGVEVEHGITLANMESGTLSLQNSDLYGPKLWSYKDNDGNAHTGAKPWELAEAGITTSDDIVPAYITDKYVGINATNAVDPTSLGDFFDSAAYKGAVDPANSWLKGTWYKID